LDGFGAAMSDSSAYVLNQLKTSHSTQYSQVMSDLFDPTNGIGISFVRVTISATDFSLSNYTYDDTSGDTNLINFSIAHDQKYMIPVLLDALKLNPTLKFMATPWTAPIWMKTSNAWGSGTLQGVYYEAYGNYWVKTIQAWSQAGITFYALTPQNEPGFAPGSYPGMTLSVDNEVGLVGSYLGPKFAAAGIKTKILIYDHNWDNYQYPLSVLANATANQYTAGVAFHCYGGSVSAQSTVHNAYPNKEIYFTECSGTGNEDTNAFGSNLMWNAVNLYVGGLTNWARSVIHWNLALNTNFGPTNGGCSNCRGVVTVDTNSGSYTKNSEYYNIGQASKFIKTGANRIRTSGGGNGIISTAFVNPNGTVALYVGNTNGGSSTFTVQSPGSAGCFTYTLKPGIATFVFSPYQA